MVEMRCIIRSGLAVAGTNEGRSRSMGWTFLIVDASEAERKEAARQLRLVTQGAQILEAASAPAAMALLEEHRTAPSLVIAEYDLPGMHGVDLIGEFRHRRWLERVPVAITSHIASDKTMMVCYRLGACAFLSKPLKSFELREVIRDFARPAVQMTAATVVPPAGAPNANARNISAA